MLLFLVFWLYLAYCVPYTQDDWDWGLDVGMRHWLTADYNNRYVGTFFVIIMTRSVIAKVLVLGGGMFTVPVLLALLAAPEDDESGSRPFLPLYLAANLLMVLMPPRIWRQSCGWVSGFANYGVSAIAFLGWLLLMRAALRPRTVTYPLPGKRLNSAMRKKKKGGRRLSKGGRRVQEAPSFAPRWPLALLLLVYTFALGLFVETQSAISLLASVIALLYACRLGRGRLCAAAALAGAAAGCAVIFFNPLYGDLASQGHALEGIRNLSFPAGASLPEAIGCIWDRFYGYLIPLLFEVGFSYSLLLAGITALALWRSKCRPLCVLALWPAVYGYLMYTGHDSLPEPLANWGGLASLALAVLAAGLAGGPLLKRMTRMGSLMAGIAIIAPMALVMDVGGRLYFLTYLLAVYAFLDLAAPLLRKPLLVTLCAVTVALGMYGWARNYTDVLLCSALRRELILTAVARGDAQVIVPTEDHDIIEWERNPSADWRAAYYKDFYGIPRELQIIYLPAGTYERWPHYTEEDLARAVTYPP